MTITQPDGTSIQCFASGDEFHNWIHTKDNYTIIKSQKDGYYYYATKEGGKIVPSKYKVENAPFKSTEIKPGVNLSAAEIKKKRRKKLANIPFKTTSLKHDITTINMNQLCIYIRFNDDDEFSKDTAIYYDWLNDETPGVSSLYNYYDIVSYNHVFIKSHFFPRSTTSQVISYKDKENRRFFEPYNETTNSDGYDPDETDRSNPKHPYKREWDLLNRAIDSIKKWYPTFPSNINLDHDNDGKIDNIIFFIKGSTGAWNDLLWPHNFAIYDRTIELYGKEVFNYNFQIENSTDNRGVGVLCHEMGHALGYPDYYHYEDEGIEYEPVGIWDLMATTPSTPQGMSAYSKYKYGKWITEIPEITTAGTYTIYPIDTVATDTKKNCYKIASPYSDSEFFVVEYRKKQGIYEIGLPGEGLLIYRINSDVESDGNAQGPPDELYVIRPGGALNVNGQINDAALSENENRTEVDNFTSHVFLSDGNPAGLYISEVSTLGKTMTFKVDFNPDGLYADFSANDTEIYARKSVTFTDKSKGNPDSWEWTFEGGKPFSFSGQNPPEIKYDTIGAYDVTFTVKEGEKTITKTLKDYIKVEELPGAVPPENLSSTTNGLNVTLNWDAPPDIIQEFTLRWDDTNLHNAIGNGESSGKFEALSHWEPEDLTPYDEMYISALTFYANSSTPATANNFTLKLYAGDTLGTAVIDEAIAASNITLNKLNTIELSAPHQIDASKHLWFGFENDSDILDMGYPFGVDNGPAITGKGDVLKSGTNISNLSEINDELDFNWILFATVKSKLADSKSKEKTYVLKTGSKLKSASGYNVYRDDEKLNTSVITETTYTDNNLAIGTYDYYVTAIYNAGESLPSNVISVEVDDNVSIPTEELREIKIYPNPVKEKLVLQLEKYTNEEVKLQIFDQNGKEVFVKELNPQSDRIEIGVSNFSDGAYSLLLWGKEEIYKGKFIVLK